MTPNPLWILYGWLAAIPVWWVIAARWLGTRVDEIRAWSVRQSKASYPRMNAHLDPEVDGWSRFSLVAAALFFTAPLWPILLPCVAFFARGRNLAKTRAEIKKRLKIAEAEIERIKRQEGWT